MHNRCLEGHGYCTFLSAGRLGLAKGLLGSRNADRALCSAARGRTAGISVLACQAGGGVPPDRTLLPDAALV